jgi:hypothetical protein
VTDPTRARPLVEASRERKARAKYRHWVHVTRPGRKAVRRQARQVMARMAAPYRAHYEGRRTEGWRQWRAQREAKLEQEFQMLNELGVKDLKDRAKSAKLKGYGKLKKPELVLALVRHKHPHPTAHLRGTP